MSTLPENELDLDKLFLPAWAQGSTSNKQYANYEVREDRSDRRGDRGDRPRGPRPPRDSNRPAGPRLSGPRPEGRGGDNRGPRREGGFRPGQGGRPQRFGGPRDQRPRQEAPAPPPEISTSFTPEEKGVESLSRQIKMTGRAYPLFDIARLILDKPERHSVTFTVKKKADGQIAQPLFLCALDESLWLSENDAVAHVLRKHFATFYQPERTATEPPKGVYTFVAQCGMSGAILGPPNHHDYQNQLRKLHTARFSRMPFEAFKASVKIVRDEETVKKWVEEQSWKTEFVCLNVPEALRLPNRDEVEKHFRSVHKESIIKSVETHTLSGKLTRELKSSELLRLVRAAWDEQRRFPLQIATTLSQQFARQGLQFFKVNKTVTHVSVARPNFLDIETTPVSETIKRIVDFINNTTKCTRRKLFEALAPAAPVAPAAPAAAEGDATPAAPVPTPEPSPEQTAVNADLHWLIHQGHVIEFANGVMETAKKPLPKPPKPAKATTGKSVEAPAATESTEVVTAEQIAATPASEEASTLPEPTVGSEAPAASDTPSAS
ncbi:MAG: hypothetical protein U1F65_10030 [Verrucomicrobiota bacterium]